MNSCFFIGHADAPEEVFAQLTQTVERLIVKENVGYFYVGGYGNFDRLAAMKLPVHFADAGATISSSRAACSSSGRF